MEIVRLSINEIARKENYDELVQERGVAEKRDRKNERQFQRGIAEIKQEEDAVLEKNCEKGKQRISEWRA